MPMQKIPDFIEKRLLEEYRELGLCWRHDDEMFSKLTAVLLPLSIAALALPYLKPETPKLLAVTGGLVLMIYWFITACLYARRIDIWFSRMRKIEQTLGLYSHRKYHKKRCKEIPDIIDRKLKFRLLRLCLFVLRGIIDKKLRSQHFQSLCEIIDKKLSFRGLRLRVFQLYIIITFLITLNLQGGIYTNDWGIIKFAIALNETIWWSFNWEIIKFVIAAKSLDITVETAVYFCIACGGLVGSHIIYRSCCDFPQEITSPEDAA